MTPVGLQIYNWRVREGLSVSDAARSLNLSRAALDAIEKGKRKPRNVTLKKIESVTGLLEKSDPAASALLEHEEKPSATYVSFTDRLARSRGFASMDEYKQAIQAESPATVEDSFESEETPKPNEEKPNEEAREAGSSQPYAANRVFETIGFVKGVQAVTRIDLSEVVEMLTHFAKTCH